MGAYQTKMKKIKTALISIYNKKNLRPLLNILKKKQNKNN